MAAKLTDQAQTIKAEVKKHGDELAQVIINALQVYKDKVGEYPYEVGVECDNVGEGEPRVAVVHDLLGDAD